MNKDIYVEDLEERIFNLEKRLDNYDFFMFKDMFGKFCIDVAVDGDDNIITLYGIGEESIVLKMNMYCACKVKTMPLESFIEWVYRETGLVLKIFHGDMINLSRTWKNKIQKKSIVGTSLNASELLRYCPWGTIVSKHLTEFELNGR